jgi:hypothetical protein
METIMEMTAFRRLTLKTKQERTLYSSLIGYRISRKTSSLISPTRKSRLTVLRLDTTHTLFDSSGATLPRMAYFTLRRFIETTSGTLVLANRRVFLCNPD